MKIHFDWVWSQMAIGYMYDKNLKTTFIFLSFIMIGIRIKKQKQTVKGN